jgi:hypothetical protein
MRPKFAGIIMPVVAAALLCLFAGCNKETFWISSVGGPGWDGGTLFSKAPNPVPGLDQVSMTAAVFSDGTTFVVWTDFHGGSSIFLPPASTKSEGFVIEGHHSDSNDPNGPKVDCRLATKDGRTGKVTIGDKTFELANGSFFLVSTHGGGTQIRQLKRNSVKLGTKDMQELAKSDAEIREFYLNAAQPK